MMHIILPLKTKVHDKANLVQCNDIILLFGRHGFGIAEFAQTYVSFYDQSALVKEDHTIPVSSYFKMKKSEFVMIVNIIKRLDTMERKKNSLLKIISHS